jgi:hypothetical protein
VTNLSLPIFGPLTWVDAILLLWFGLTLASVVYVAREPVLEESYYWRGLARGALGDREAGIQDLREALLHHPGCQPAVTELQRLGENP